MPTQRTTRRVRTTTFALLTAAAACSPDAIPTSPPRPTHTNPLLAPTLVVTNTDDSGPGSLRQAIADAAGGAIILFDPSIAGKTIVLSTGALSIDKSLTIEGPATGGMTVSGNLQSGVVVVTSTGDAVLRNLSIVNGFAQVGGGVHTRGKLLLDHSLIANNTGISGGGISAADAATVNVVNTTVSGNTALDGGGGIYSAGPGINLRNSTVARNTAARGGGLFTPGAILLRNSTIAQNIVETGVNTNCYLTTVALKIFTGVNLVDDDTCGDAGDALVVSGAGLGPLANNGGPTMTHALQLGSRAIDAGTQCTEATDQRSVARPLGTSCDIGAYEFDAFVDLTMTVSPNAIVNAKTGELTVTGTLTCPGPFDVTVDVRANQTQKTTGRFQTIVQAAGTTTVTCTGPTSWSVTLSAQSGRFETGAATATASTFTVVRGVLSSTVTSSLRVFAVK